MVYSDSPTRRTAALIGAFAQRLTVAQRRELLRWARTLMDIQRRGGPAIGKVWQAMDATRRSRVALLFLQTLTRALGDGAWTNRGWGVRLGTSVALATLATAGTQGAGIAALGTAVGIPLWALMGGGGAALGVVIDELEGSLRRTWAASDAEERPGACAHVETVL